MKPFCYAAFLSALFLCQPALLRGQESDTPRNKPAGFNLPGLARGILSQEQVAEGLKQALSQGVHHAITRLSAKNGFLNDPNVRIPIPEKLAPIERTLRRLKQDQLVDEWITNMNHAAELAVKEAGPIFTAAITNMTLADVQKILDGPDDAATQFFRRVSEDQLKERMLPIVQDATARAGATSTYKRVLERARFGVSLLDRFQKNPLDLDSYVTDRAVDGLFKVIAEKEKAIRQNPAEQTTDLLKKVFGRFLDSNKP